MNMSELKINVKGMMCTGCENRIKNAIGEIKGIKSVDANHKTGQVVINSDKSLITQSAARSSTASSFHCSPFSHTV